MSGMAGAIRFVLYDRNSKSCWIIRMLRVGTTPFQREVTNQDYVDELL